MKRHVLFLIIIISTLYSCVRRALYVSPFNGNNITYHTIPLVKDSIKSAIFVNSAFYNGEANFDGRDKLFDFESSICRTNQFKNFQAYYGANFSFGNYNVSTYDSTNNSNTIDYKVINSLAGRKSFQGIGIQAGVNFVKARKIIEFRSGIEGSFQKDYGNYLKFRKEIPDSSATFIVRNNSLTSLGVYIDMLFKLRKGSCGFKIALSKVFTSAYNNLYLYRIEPNEHIIFRYFNVALHYSLQKWTIFLQPSTATKADGFKIGMNYLLLNKHNK